MNFYRFTAITVLLAAAACAQQACGGLPRGKHSLLEGMTAEFGLTCEQELKIEPLLHDEESVTKPLLKFSSLSPEERHEIMLTIKLAARRQVRTVLTAGQQKGLDKEEESVSKGGGGGKKVGANKNEGMPGVDGEGNPKKAIL